MNATNVIPAKAEMISIIPAKAEMISVIPAKAGIQGFRGGPHLQALDPRLRGDDGEGT